MLDLVRVEVWVVDLVWVLDAGRVPDAVCDRINDGVDDNDFDRVAEVDPVPVPERV